MEHVCVKFVDPRAASVSEISCEKIDNGGEDPTPATAVDVAKYSERIVRPDYARKPFVAAALPPNPVGSLQR